MLETRHMLSDDCFAASSGFASRGPVLVTVDDLLQLLGVPPMARMGEGAWPISLWRVRAGATLFHEGAPSGHLFIVRTGAFKSLRVSEDGYEQVLSFAVRGDVLGFEALCRNREPLAAVALEDATVFVLPLRDLDDWRLRCPALDHGLLRALSGQLARAAEISEMMAAVSAEVRLARFLVWLSACAEDRGESPTRLLLRMNRRELASLLGVAHETISRAFGTLADAGLLEVDKREVHLLDIAAIRSCARSTRRPIDDTPRHEHLPMPGRTHHLMGHAA